MRRSCKRALLTNLKTERRKVVQCTASSGRTATICCNAVLLYTSNKRCSAMWNACVAWSWVPPSKADWEKRLCGANPQERSFRSRDVKAQVPNFVKRPGTPQRHHNYTTLHWLCSILWMKCSAPNSGCGVCVGVVCPVFARRLALVDHRHHILCCDVMHSSATICYFLFLNELQSLGFTSIFLPLLLISLL